MINAERLLDTFLRYVQIDSESGHEKVMGETLVRDVKALGLDPITDKAGETFGSDGFNVFFRFPGTLPGDPFVLSAHMDTVVPGKGIRPGDDKSGICGILEAITTILEKGLPHRTAEVVFSIGEEGGMRGAKAFDMTQLQSKRAFVLDSSGDVGKVIVGAPGQIKVFADVVGKRAHAGLAPEQGISAIQVAAKGIAKMNLLRIDEETTCNIGTIKAEYATKGEPRRRGPQPQLRQAERPGRPHEGLPAGGLRRGGGPAGDRAQDQLRVLPGARGQRDREDGAGRG